MTPERYRRIQLLAESALQLAPDQRRAYLDQQCASDEALRHDVERLIAADAQAGDYLKTPAPVKFAHLLSAEQGTEAMPNPPTMLNDRYAIERELGRGGFGAAYLARDLNLHSRLVVVKVLQPATGADSQPINEYTKRKFRGEIDALTRFRHPHIVSILDQGSLPNGDPFFVMEFIEGATLRAAMKSTGLEFARVAHIISQLGQALSYAHERGVYHRDLKPGNVMLRDDDGSVAVIDFGIATVQAWPHATRGSANTPRTPRTWISGTHEYMAPEQLRGAPSAASDIWAQGVIAYEMLTGQLPFTVPCDAEGKVQLRELYETLRAGVNLKPQDLRPDLPAAAAAAILRALSFDPQDRYQNAHDFGAAVAQALTSQSPSLLHSAPTKIVTPETETASITEPLEYAPAPEVVICYDNHDLRHAQELAQHLRAAGVNFWMTDHAHEAISNDRSATLRAIKQSKLLLPLCSDAALRSPSVKQELQHAWVSKRPFLPLLVEPIDCPEQTAYWLEGQSTIELATAPASEWLPKLLRALNDAGIACPRADRATFATAPIVAPTLLDSSLQSLRIIARFTDQIWPLPAERAAHGTARSGVRGLGAPQDDVQHGYRLGSRVRLAIESERANAESHLLLLDEGPEGIIYCLCPSQFAPDTRLRDEYTELPQARSRYDSFVVTGKPGREHLVAIISDEPLGLDWLPSDPKVPARVLKQADVERLLARLREIEASRWMALSTYFDVVD